jgi:glycosyltransferase involved in cell wall biosynthesis
MTYSSTPRKKILIFIYSMSSGGAERVTANLANYWARKGWDITIVTLASCDLDFYQLHLSVKRVALELAGNSENVLLGLKQNLCRILALRQVLRQIQPDIALGMMTGANVLLALAAFSLSNLRTIGAERTHPPQIPLGYLWETLRCYTYRLLNAVTVLTSESEDWIRSNTYAQTVSMMPNAVFYPLSAQEPHVNPNNTERKRLLAVGRLSEEKRFNYLIEVFANLATSYPHWDLVILGEGVLRSALEQQIRELALEKRIFLMGRVGNVAEWYESADIYVMSSRFEGFPNTLIEAMSYGLPAISFDCDTGPRDIIRHEIDGLLVPAGNIVALTAALDRLMSNKELRLKLAERAIEVRERFSIEKVTQLWEQLFDEVGKK